MKKIIPCFLLGMLIMFLSMSPQHAQAKTYKIAWSHYTGWEPWELARYSGIIEKWGSKYGIKIQLDLINDYVESINLYTAGSYDGCVMTNMDALTIPSVGGVDSSAIIIGDFSNGNDGIVMRNGRHVKDLKGRKVNLVELSVSHYLLARALEINNMTEKELKLINTSDSDIIALFEAESNGAAVTWNPLLIQCRNLKRARLVFDSSRIPGEIIDMLVVHTQMPDKVKKALTGAWYETMTLMSGKNIKAKEAIAYMARFAGGTIAEFKAQLRTTQMFYKAKDAVAFAKSDQLKKTMEYVRAFCFDHGLYGDAESKDLVGVLFPDDSIIGDKSNVKLRFDSSYMQMAAENNL